MYAAKVATEFRQTFGRSVAQTNRAWRTALAGIFAGTSIDAAERP